MYCGAVIYSQLVLQATVVMIEVPTASLERCRVLWVVVQFCHPEGRKWRERVGGTGCDGEMGGTGCDGEVGGSRCNGTSEQVLMFG